MEQYDDYRTHVMKVYLPDITAYYDMHTGKAIITSMKCNPELSDLVAPEDIITGTEYDSWVTLDCMERIYTLLSIPYPFRRMN